MRTGQTHVSPTIPAPQPARSAQIRLMPGRTHTAWEATIAGVLSPGDRVLVLGAGPIPTLWAAIAERAALLVEVMTEPSETAIARHLGADRFGVIKAVFAAHGEPGADLDPPAVRRALDVTHHDALFLVDASAASAPDLRACYADIVLSDPDAGLAHLAPRHPIAAE